MRRARLLACPLLAGALILAGCSGEEEPEGETPAEPSAEVAPELETWPLTGLPLGEAEAPKHPVLVVKIDNTSPSSPQAGLGSADLVVEELVEGGSTRLATFFYSDIPKVVGPVRSMRASDIGIVTPSDAVVVTSGAASQTITRITDAGIAFFSEGARGMFRDDARSSPYNLFAELRTIARRADTPTDAPADYLPWGAEGDTVTGRAAPAMQVAFSAGHATEWAFEDGAYRQLNAYAAETDEFLADTVLVLRVEVGDAGYTDPAGNPVPETTFEGSGRAWLFHGGKVRPATWTKDDLGAPLELATRDGEDVTVPPGHTWIELMPATTGSLSIGAGG